MLHVSFESCCTLTFVFMTSHEEKSSQQLITYFADISEIHQPYRIRMLFNSFSLTIGRPIPGFYRCDRQFVSHIPDYTKLKIHYVKVHNATSAACQVSIDFKNTGAVQVVAHDPRVVPRVVRPHFAHTPHSSWAVSVGGSCVANSSVTQDLRSV